MPLKIIYTLKFNIQLGVFFHTALSHTKENMSLSPLMNKSYLSLKGLRCNEQQQTCLRHFECTFPATYKLTKGLNRIKNWMKRFYHVSINVDSHFKSSYSLCKKTVSKTIRLEIKLYLISSDNLPWEPSTQHISLQYRKVLTTFVQVCAPKTQYYTFYVFFCK